MIELTDRQIDRIKGALNYWSEKGISISNAFTRLRNNDRPRQWNPMSVALRDIDEILEMVHPGGVSVKGLGELEAKFIELEKELG